MVQMKRRLLFTYLILFHSPCMLLVQTNLVFMNLKMIQEVDLSCRAIHGL